MESKRVRNRECHQVLAFVRRPGSSRASLRIHVFGRVFHGLQISIRRSKSTKETTKCSSSPPPSLLPPRPRARRESRSSFCFTYNTRFLDFGFGDAGAALVNHRTYLFITDYSSSTVLFFGATAPIYNVHPALTCKFGKLRHLIKCKILNINAAVSRTPKMDNSLCSSQLPQHVYLKLIFHTSLNLPHPFLSINKSVLKKTPTVLDMLNGFFLI